LVAFGLTGETPQLLPPPAPSLPPVPAAPPLGDPAVGELPPLDDPAVGELPPLGDPAIGEPPLGDPAIGEPPLGDPAIGELPPCATPPVEPAVPLPAVAAEPLALPLPPVLLPGLAAAPALAGSSIGASLLQPASALPKETPSSSSEVTG